jgi:2-polyprenyl-3-methyl-5-hydroxy-6-metoxy-1,4-benzoquinol methylase
VSDRDVLAGRRAGRAIPAVDATLIERLNELWRLQPSDAPVHSWKQRLARPVRRAVALVLRPQETFNSAVVQYVNSSINALDGAAARCEIAADQVYRTHEALSARERRMEAAMAAMRAEHQELRTTIGILQQQIRTARAAQPSAQPAASSPSLKTRVETSAGPTVNATLALSEKYVGFEDQFRGSADDIRARLTEYVGIFEGASDVLDIGCGRGEFLRLLRERGITAQGIDLNAAMVDVCRQQGFETTQADALTYLRAQPDGSLGGLFAAQVVEHLDPAYLTHLIDTAFDKLRPGAAIVLETINPACWFAFFESYIRDITHVRALHPDTLKFLLVATGFQRIDIQYRAPYPAHEKLQRVSEASAAADSAETFNANVDKLNSLLFTYLDYAAVGRRP